MSSQKRTSSRQARAALLAALTLLFGAGGFAAIRAQGTVMGQTPSNEAQRDTVPYKSSIQVPDNDKEEASEADEADEKGEKAEADEKGEQNEANESDEKNEQGEASSAEERTELAQYQKLARITAAQARSAAVAAVPGTVKTVELENEDGNLVYGVSIKTTKGDRDVKVDAGNGRVLHISNDEQD